MLVSRGGLPEANYAVARREGDGRGAAYARETAVRRGGGYRSMLRPAPSPPPRPRAATSPGPTPWPTPHPAGAPRSKIKISTATRGFLTQLYLSAPARGIRAWVWCGVWFVLLSPVGAIFSRAPPHKPPFALRPRPSLEPSLSTWRAHFSFFSPPPLSVGGLDLGSRNSGCARPGGGEVASPSRGG